MTSLELQALLKEIMNKYDMARLVWIDHFGSDIGFNDWFTKQIIKEVI